MSILAQCYTLGHKYVIGYDPSAIESNPVGVRLVFVSFEDPPGEAGNRDHCEEFFKKSHKVYSLLQTAPATPFC